MLSVNRRAKLTYGANSVVVQGACVAPSTTVAMDGRLPLRGARAIALRETRERCLRVRLRQPDASAAEARTGGGIDELIAVRYRHSFRGRVQLDGTPGD